MPTPSAVADNDALLALLVDLDSWRREISAAPSRQNVELLERRRKDLASLVEELEAFKRTAGRRTQAIRLGRMFSDRCWALTTGPEVGAALKCCADDLQALENEIAYQLSDLAGYRDLRAHPDYPGFDPMTELMGMRFMVEVGNALSDEGFLEDGAILGTMWMELGPLRSYDFVMALRVLKAGHRHRLQDRRRAWRIVQRACAQITAADKKNTSGWTDPCYNRLRPRLKMNGEVVIIVDQPGNAEYVPPVITGLRTTMTTGCRRARGRTRSSAGRPGRLRARSRAGARGGGDPPDDGGDGGPGDDADPPALASFSGGRR